MCGFRGPVGVPGCPVSPSIHLVPPGKEVDGPVNAPTATSPAVATQRGKGRCLPRASVSTCPQAPPRSAHSLGTRPSAAFAFPTDQGLLEDRTCALLLPRAAMVAKLLVPLDFVVGLASSKPWVGEGDERESPQVALSVEQVSAAPTPPTLHLLPIRQARQFPVAGSEDALGPGAGAAGSRAERKLILRACGQCRPCWVRTAVPAEPSPWPWSRVTLVPGT